VDKNTPINIIAEVVNIAEHTSYLELVSRVCFYNEPNLNGDMLPYDDTSLEKAQTLVNMPVQAKYRVNSDGTPSLGGHEMVKKRDGTIEFKTQSIGTHTSVEIKNDNVLVNGSIKELPCLFASYRIWKRYPNYIAAIKRLFDNGILYGSWEINTYQYLYDNGIRKITDYEFIANCLLGETSYPSYGTSANAISMSETNNENPQLMIAEALSQDLIDENDNKEENSKMGKKNDTVVAEDVTQVTPKDTDSTNSITATENIKPEEQNKDTAEKEKPITDSAQLTSYDLRMKVNAACRAKIDKWCWVAYMFPNEKEVWCEYDGAESELDYVRFTYEVGEDDSITVSEPEYVKLTVSIAEVNTKISELEKENQTVKAELDIKNDAITKASETIQNLNTQISELKPYKEQVEVAERKKIEDQITAEKESLKAKLLKGNLFTAEEIADKKIQDLIEARDVSAINGLIADRFVASFDKKTNEAGSVTTAETQNKETAAASLVSDEDDTDVRSFMRKILFN